jgi:uncharacterized protein YndB with AHSA1/START domain
MSDSSNGWELSVTTHIDAPTNQVWHAMTERMPEWFCPRPWRAEPGRQDRRAGGIAEMTMYGPNGEVQPSTGIYLAWEPGKRFAFTDALTPDLMPAGPFMVGVFEIAPEGKGTRYTARARHWTEQAMKQHKEMGFEGGWQICAEQLKELCESTRVE